MTVIISHPGVATPVDTSRTSQDLGLVAPLSDGGYLILWRATDLVYVGNVTTQAQRYDSSGQKVGSPFSVSLPSGQSEAALTALTGGGFVIARTILTTGPSSSIDIQVQRYDAAGVAVGASVIANTTVASNQVHPDVVGLSDGSFIVSWSGYGGARIQHFDANGGAIGTEILVDSLGDNYSMSVSALANGGFVAAWAAHHASDTQSNIYAQRYTSAGATSGGQITVTTGSTYQRSPAVATLNDGSFVVVWDKDAYPAAGGVFGQHYSATGATVGGAFQINTTAQGVVGFTPVITALTNGGFVVVWDTAAGSNSSAVFAQAYDSAGVKDGGELQIGNSLVLPSVMALAGGGFSITWIDTLYGGAIETRVIGGTVTTPYLSSTVDIAAGDSANDTFYVTPATLNSGDVLNGNGGNDVVQQTTTGTLDFTGVTLTSIEKIVGTSGADTFIFAGAPPSGVTFDSGGGSDRLVVGAALDLSTLSLTGQWTVAAAAGSSVTFTATDLAQMARIDGLNANVTVSTGLTLSAEQRATLFAQGVDQVRQAGGLTVNAGDSAQRLGAATSVASTVSGFNSGSFVSALAGGGYVVTSVIQQQNYAYNVYVQRFDSSGAKLGGQVLVNPTSDSSTTASGTVGLTGGGFVVFWSTYTSGGYNPYNVHAQIFTANVAKSGAELVFAGTSSDPGPVSAAATSDGGFVVANTLLLPSNNAAGFLSHYSATGALVSATQSNHGGGVDVLADGSFITTWFTQADGVHLQKYSAAGVASGGEILIAGTDAGTSKPSVTALTDGGYLVTWSQNWSGDQLGTIYAQRYSAANAAVGSAVVVNPHLLGAAPSTPQAMALPDGGFLISWSVSINVNGQQTGFAYEQRYDNAGHRLGDEIQVPTTASDILSDGSQVFTFTTISQYTQVYTTWIQTLTAIDYHNLTAGADVVAGTAQETWVVGAASQIGAADSLLGGDGLDKLELTASGTVDFTALVAFGGFEQLVGASGNDTFIFSHDRLAGLTSIDGAGGVNKIMLAAPGALDFSSVTLSHIDQIIGSSGADLIIGSAAADTIAGGAGDDILTGGDGSDMLDGGTGYDIAVYDAVLASAAVVHNLDGSWTVTVPGAGADTLTGFEALRFIDRDIRLLAPNAAVNDLTGDHVSDVLLQNAAGALALGQIGSGNQLTYVAAGGLGAEWSFKGVGDFRNSGSMDFLIQNTAGAVVLGHATSLGAVVYTPIAALGSEWHFKGVGSYLGDGKDGFLIQNTSGAVVVGELGTGGLVAYTQLTALGSEWTFRGSGDLLHTGHDQFLIQSSAGDLVAADYSGGQIHFSQIGGLGPEWSIVGIGDFYNDGRADILIESNTGAIYTGEVGAGGQLSYAMVGALGSEWHFKGVGDYLGSASDDFLIESSVSGAVVVGQIIGGAAQYTQVSALGSDWIFHP